MAIDRYPFSPRETNLSLSDRFWSKPLPFVFITKADVNWTNLASITQKSGEGAVTKARTKVDFVLSTDFTKTWGLSHFRCGLCAAFTAFWLVYFHFRPHGKIKNDNHVTYVNRAFEPKSAWTTEDLISEKISSDSAPRICLSAVVYRLVWILLAPDNDDMDLLFISGRQLLQSFCFGAWFCFALLGKLLSARINRPIFAAIQLYRVWSF